jgi:monooxygenase
VPEKVAFKGFLLNDVPNFVYLFGYTNSSWTLKVGLVCEHFCRLLAHMDAQAHTVCYPRLPGPMETRPLLEVTAGYVKRSAAQFPHQGVEGPWRTCMDYRADHKTLREGPVDDDNLCFATPSTADALEPALAG